MTVQRVAGLALLALLLTGCSGISNYTATADVDGRQYSVCNKRGALLEITQPDGAHIVSDDYAARWPELTPPTAQECSDFLAQVVIEIDRPWGEVLVENGLQTIQTEEP